MQLNAIVVPVDFSDSSPPAIAAAVDWAQTTGAKLVLVHVIDMVYYDYGWLYEGVPVPKDILSRNEDRVRDKMLALVPADVREKLRVESMVVHAQPWEGILQAVKDAHADLIVMGTHGRRGLTHMFLGSVAEKVVRLAPCPVLTVKAKAQDAQPAK